MWTLAEAKAHARATERSERLGLRRSHMVTVPQLLAEESERLLSLRGKTLRFYDVLWDVGRDEWVADERIALNFGDLELSIWAFQTYLCISWNRPDRRDRLEFWRSDVFAQLAWRSDVIPELNQLTGRPLELLQASAYLGELNALGFGSGNGYCEVHNAGDELGVRLADDSAEDATPTVYWDDRAGS
jgi:hypothetical protein